MARAAELPVRGKVTHEASRRSWTWGGGRRYFLLVYGLLVFGLVMVLSASYPVAGRPTPAGGDPYQFFRRQLEAAALGLVAMFLLSRLRVRHLAWLAVWVGLPFSLLLMLYTCFHGVEVSGTRGWLEFAGHRFHPAELAKVVYVAVLAVLIARGPVHRRNWGRIVLPAVGLIGAMTLMLLAQSDLGMIALFMGIALGMGLLAGMKMRWWIPSLLSLVGLALLFAKMAPYRWARIEAWLQPDEHIRGVGFHIYAMLVALSRGGPVGLGLGMSPDKWRTLPVPHTDSIFCVVGGELGAWGAVGLVLLMALLALWAFDVARRCPHRLGWFMASGMGLALALQGFINIAVATACVPATGLTLPFFSAGGTSLFASLAMAGVVLAVAAESRPEPGG